MNRKFKNKLTLISSVIVALSASSSFASDFNIPFINASGLGNAYADWATNTDDASNTFSNPAGMTDLHHQQLVIVPLGIEGSTQFLGTTTSLIPPPIAPETGTASSRISAFMPSFYYSYPINEKWALGVSATTPFALGTSYQKDSIVRYISTRTNVLVMDMGPELAYQVNDRFSLGVGVDLNRLTSTINNMARSPIPLGPDLEQQNHITGYGVGWHGGILYQWFPQTRVGLSFNSMVAIHASGNTELFVPELGEFRRTNQVAYARLPARTQLSIHQDLTDRVAIMATLYYTNWRSFNQLTLKRTLVAPPLAVPVTIPFNYHNTFDYSVGMDFKATDKWTLRTGVQLLSTPTNDRDRGVADPVGSAAVLAFGGHYQQNTKLGYDLGIAHSFFKNEPVNLVTPVATATGNNQTQTTVIGAQLNWNIS